MKIVQAEVMAKSIVGHTPHPLSIDTQAISFMSPFKKYIFGRHSDNILFLEPDNTIVTILETSLTLFLPPLR